ncbi:MAG: hypothetical protein LBQ84_02240 [Flavobacteriaceae bacterium]|jgi:hypothetical protein|nr:hypothetical protein [Flavobacteriaceae bacterium]
MKKVYFILLITVFYALPATAQIAVGGSKPEPGAIIDLNSPYPNSTDRIKGGLLLSNVELPNVTTIPTSLTGITTANQSSAAVKAALVGALVWNRNENKDPNRPVQGVYIWTGDGATNGWKYLGGSD